jgi:hypothetical protein
MVVRIDSSPAVLTYSRLLLSKSKLHYPFALFTTLNRNLLASFAPTTSHQCSFAIPSEVYLYPARKHQVEVLCCLALCVQLLANLCLVVLLKITLL